MLPMYSPKVIGRQTLPFGVFRGKLAVQHVQLSGSSPVGDEKPLTKQTQQINTSIQYKTTWNQSKGPHLVPRYVYIRNIQVFACNATIVPCSAALGMLPHPRMQP